MKKKKQVGYSPMQNWKPAKPAGTGDLLGIMFGSGLKVTASKKQVQAMPTIGKSKKNLKQARGFFGVGL